MDHSIGTPIKGRRAGEIFLDISEKYIIIHICNFQPFEHVQNHKRGR